MNKSVIFYVIITILGIVASVLNKVGPLSGKLNIVGLVLFTIVWVALAFQFKKDVGKIIVLAVSYVIILIISL